MTTSTGCFKILPPLPGTNWNKLMTNLLLFVEGHLNKRNFGNFGVLNPKNKNFLARFANAINLALFGHLFTKIILFKT